MGIDFRGLDIGMAHQLLHHTDIGSIFKQMGGKTVAKGMAGYPFVNTSQFTCPLHRLLQARLLNMVPPLLI